MEIGGTKIEDIPALIAAVVIYVFCNLCDAPDNASISFSAAAFLLVGCWTELASGGWRSPTLFFPFGRHFEKESPDRFRSFLVFQLACGLIALLLGIYFLLSK